MSKAVANQLFVAYLGRPADLAWQSSTTAVTDAMKDAPSAALQTAFYNAAVADGRFSASDSSSTLVNKIFLNTFGFAASAFEQTAWSNLVANGTVTTAGLAWTIFSSYLGATNVPASYQLPAQSKLVAAEAFTAALTSTANAAYSQIGSAASATGRAYLDAVVSQATAATAITNVATTIAGTTSSTGTTFTLTTGVDSITGTSGDDTISGAAGTLTALDNINGGSGTDTLAVATAAAYTGGATITNIEKITLNQITAGGFNASGIAGLTDINTLASTVDIAVTSLATAANIGVTNQDTAVTITYADTAVSGAANAVKLTLNNVAQAAGTAIALNNTTTLTGATGIETLTIAADGVAGTSANTVTVNTNATQSLTTVNFTGASAANITLGTNITTTATTLNASTMTGALTLSGLGAVVDTVTLGTGNDSVNFGVAGNFTSADIVNGGAGTDTLRAVAADLALITTTDANITNIETISTTDANIAVTTTINLALFGASNYRSAGDTTSTGAVTTINNIATGGNVRIDAGVAAAAELVLNVKDATLPGTTDTLNLDLRGTSATHNATIAGVETFNVDISNAVTAETLGLVATAGTTINLTNTGAATFNTGTLGSSFTTVNLSGETGTGTNTVVMAAANTNGASITGSANADTITTTAGTDVINAGAGNDIINALGGADRINVGTGNDTVLYTVAAQTTELATPATLVSGTTIISATVDQITGLGAGDIISLTGISGTYTGTVGTTIAGAAGTTVSITRGDYNTSTGIWTTSTTGADSILAFDADAATTAATLTDFSVLIGFTGVASTIAAGVITLG
jgi:hypothetical protein